MSTGMSTAGCSSTIRSSIGDEPDRIGLDAFDTRQTSGLGTACIMKHTIMQVIILLQCTHFTYLHDNSTFNHLILQGEHWL